MSPADARENIESAAPGELDRQPSPSLRPPASQDPTPVFRAHALAETVLAFLLEIRWLPRCKGHGAPPTQSLKRHQSKRTVYYRGGVPTCQFRDFADSENRDDQFFLLTHHLFELFEALFPAQHQIATGLAC